MALSLGGDKGGPVADARYFNPLTGNYDSAIRYTQHIVVGKSNRWLPKGLTMRQVRDGDTTGYKRKKAGDGVPGWVWVKQ